MPNYTVTVEITVREVTTYRLFADNEDELRNIAKRWAAKSELVPIDCTAHYVTIMEVK